MCHSNKGLQGLAGCIHKGSGFAACAHELPDILITWKISTSLDCDRERQISQHVRHFLLSLALSRIRGSCTSPIVLKTPDALTIRAMLVLSMYVPVNVFCFSHCYFLTFYHSNSTSFKRVGMRFDYKMGEIGISHPTLFRTAIWNSIVLIEVRI